MSFLPKQNQIHTVAFVTEVSILYLCSFRLVVEESVNLVDSAVVGAHDEPVVVHVEDEVLAHHGQPDQGDVGHRLNFLHHR